jgi:hypothetical protein
MEKTVRYESKAATKAMLLEILAECDPTFSDVLINRVHPIVKQLVEHEFMAQRNKLMMEVAVTIGKIIGDTDNAHKPLWQNTPEEMGIDPSSLRTIFGRTK